MTTFAYFYWPTISFSELDELISQLKDPVGKNMKIEEEYILHFRGQILNDKSVVGLSNQAKKLKGSFVKQVRLSNLSFTIESRHGKIVFDGKSSGKRLSFSESRKTNAWEQKKKKKFVKFWQGNFKHRIYTKQIRLAVALGVVGVIGLMLAYIAEFGSIISFATINFLFEYASTPYATYVDLLELTAPFLVAFILILGVLQVENMANFESYDRHLEVGKDTFTGFLISHISFLIELVLIPTIFLTYQDNQIMNRDTGISYYFLTSSVDLSAQAVLKTITISLLLGITLSIVKNALSSRIYVGRLRKRR